MRTALLFLTFLLLSGHTVYGQELYGRWISPDCEFMLFEKDLVRTSCLLKSEPGCTRGRHDDYFGWYLIKDTLRLERTLYEYPNKYDTTFYDFKIISHTNRVLSLETISTTSKKLFQGKDTLRFTRQEYAVDKNIHFEKIVFYSYAGHDWNIYQIDSIGVISMIKKDMSNKSNISYYKGQLTKSQLAKLTYLLQTCSLDALDWGSNLYTDIFEEVVIIHYNGKRKNLKSGVPSPISQPLMYFIYDIRKIELTQTDEKIDIDYRFWYQ